MKHSVLFYLSTFLFFFSYTGFSQQIIWEKGFNYLTNGDDTFITLRKVNDTTIIASGDSGNLPYKTFFTQYHNNGTLNWSAYSRLIKTGEQDIWPYGKGYFYGSQVPIATGSKSSIMLQHLGPVGDTLWTKVYSAYQDDVISKILPAHNSVYIGGQGLDLPGPLYRYFFLMRTDTLGNLLWRKKYRSGTGNDYLADVLLRPNGNIVLSGQAQTINNFQQFMVEVSPNGDSLRSKIIYIKGPNYRIDHGRIFHNILLTSDGNYLCSGTIDSAGFRMGYVAKLDTAFNLLWSRILNPDQGQQFSRASRVKELPTGNYALLTHDIPLNNKFYIYKISPAGQVLAKTTYISTYCSQLALWSWEVLPDGGGIVGGGCQANGEAYIARFGSLTTGIKEEIAASKTGIGQLYPNPAQTEAILAYNLPLTAQKASVTISDLAGKVIAAYPILAKGTGEVQLNLQAFKSGLYNCTLLIDGKPVENRKLSVIR